MKTLFTVSFILFAHSVMSQDTSRHSSNPHQLDLKRLEFANYKIGEVVYFNYRNGFASKKQKNKYLNNECQAKGLLIEKNESSSTLKIRLLEACGKRGIIAYTSKELFTKNKTTGAIGKVPNNVKFFMYVDQELWFNYADWNLKN